jgi:hypothetical protein
MMIGLPAMVYGERVKWRMLLRLPSWKIQTRAPKLALIESRVMITALSGMATDPNRRNRTIALAISVRPDGVGHPVALGDQEVVADGGLAADLVVIPLPAWRARIVG